jgi:hypothetical protein
MFHRSTIHIVLVAACLFVVSFPELAQAQQQPLCGPEVKKEIVEALANAKPEEKQALEDELYKKYQYCAQDAEYLPVIQSFFDAAQECSARVSILGSTFYEDMSCCGYDPQRRLFACPVRIKQTFGFGPAPFPGSREHVLTCVLQPGVGFVPVARDSVHLADEIWGHKPTWQFAVIAQARQNLQTVLPLNGQTRYARSILSWEFVPTHCEYKPIWGNAIDYFIRLDQ